MYDESWWAAREPAAEPRPERRTRWYEVCWPQGRPCVTISRAMTSAEKVRLLDYAYTFGRHWVPETMARKFDPTTAHDDKFYKRKEEIGKEKFYKKFVKT